MLGIDFQTKGHYFFGPRLTEALSHFSVVADISLDRNLRFGRNSFPRRRGQNPAVQIKQTTRREDAVTSRDTELRPNNLMGFPEVTAPGSGNSRLVLQAIERAQAGDSEGLHFLYVRYAPDVQRFVNSLVKDHHEAEDITQNIFAKLMKAINKYQPREVPFAAWIMRVARNAALDHLRARRAVPTEEVRLTDSGQAQIGQERGRDLRLALEELPEDQREVLILRHIAGLSPVEIAATLKKSESSVHGLHHRGRRTLQAKLAELGASPVVAPSF